MTHVARCISICCDPVLLYTVYRVLKDCLERNSKPTSKSLLRTATQVMGSHAMSQPWKGGIKEDLCLLSLGVLCIDQRWHQMTSPDREVPVYDTRATFSSAAAMEYNVQHESEAPVASLGANGANAMHVIFPIRTGACCFARIDDDISPRSVHTFTTCVSLPVANMGACGCAHSVVSLPVLCASSRRNKCLLQATSASHALTSETLQGLDTQEWFPTLQHACLRSATGVAVPMDQRMSPLLGDRQFVQY